MANTVEERGIARLTSTEFAAQFDKIVPPGPDRIGIGEWYNTYDGVWAIALTFNKTIERLASMGKYALRVRSTCAASQTEVWLPLAPQMHFILQLNCVR